MSDEVTHSTDKATGISAAKAKEAVESPSEGPLSAPGDGAGNGNGANGDETAGGIFDELHGVPVEWLIASPLLAAARANFALAQAMIDYVAEIGFEGNDGGSRKVRMITFDIDVPVQQSKDSSWTSLHQQIQVPLIAIVPIPALLVESVDVDLTVNVERHISKTKTTEKDNKLDVTASWGFGSVTDTGSYSNKSENTRGSDYSAKYDVSIRAGQQPTTEGMKKMLDIMGQGIGPLGTQK